MEKIKKIATDIDVGAKHLKYCEKKIIELLKEKIIEEEAKCKALPRVLLDFKYMDDRDVIEELVNAQPSEMLKVQKKIRKKLKTYTGRKVIEEVFLSAYESFNNINIREWGAYQYLKYLDVAICPYCNENYAYRLLAKNRNKNGQNANPDLTIRADLDHFYPKSTNPLLAMTLHNLVPSCKICNSSIKGQKEFDLRKKPLNPYAESLDSQFRFVREFGRNDNRVDVLLGHSTDFEFDIVKKETADKYESAEYMIHFFGILERYNFQHKEFIQQQVEREVIYDEVLTKGLNSFLEELDTDVEFTSQMTDFVINNQSLGKLMNDSFGEIREEYREKSAEQN